MRTRLIDHAVEWVLVGALVLAGVVVVQTGVFGALVDKFSAVAASVTEAAFAPEALVEDAPLDSYVRLVAEPTRLVPTFGDLGGEATADYFSDLPGDEAQDGESESDD